MEFHVSLVGRKDLSGEIYRQVRGAILEGRLRPGDLLPPSRELAQRLSVARTTVVVAYDRLAAEEFVTARVGAGTAVSAHGGPWPHQTRRRASEGALRPLPVWDSIPLSTAFVRRAHFDFRTGLPDSSFFPHDTWRRLLSRAMRSEAARGGLYGDPGGHRGLREAIARHIAFARGVTASADDVTVVSGTQQALDVVARTMLAPGDRVAVEDPGYPRVRWLFESLGARVSGVPVDRQGLVVDALPRRTRLVYVTPSHQYPLGVPMALSRRRELLAWAEKQKAVIVEDDYDSEFRFADRPIEPLQTLDTSGLVVYVGSFSKTMLPALRLGFVVTPPSLRVAVHKAKQITDWHTATPLQAALALFIDEGTFARHIRKMRGVYGARHALITRALSDQLKEHLDAIPSTAGLHVAALARTASVEAISAAVRRAANAGVAVQQLARFAVDGPPLSGLLLGYGSIPAMRIEEGLRRLRRCLER
jgi:GntR family transcriptional regulator / MocR family aminotransferase